MTISLVKGQKISLIKESQNQSLSKITMGLGWDVAKPSGLFGLFRQAPTIDLDASCILFDQAGNAVDAVWFRQLQSATGSIQHTGDNLTGEGEGDDEQIIVNLKTVPLQIQSLVFVVNSFSGHTFAQIKNAFCRIVDNSNNREIANFNLSCQGHHTAQIMAKIYRNQGEWKLHAIGEVANGRTFAHLLPDVLPYL